jgi:predicted metallopeptidase
MKYFRDLESEDKINEIIHKTGMFHINQERIACFKSKGTSTKNIIARCHGLSKIQQLGLKTEPFYVIELISENFDKLDEKEKIKTLIHELMHIPHNFGGGFRHHNYVNKRSVEKIYQIFKKND